MSFGLEMKESIIEHWKSEYVTFNDIKQRIQEKKAWNNVDEQHFKHIIYSEADKVESFINRMQREIESRVAYCERTLSRQTKNAAIILKDILNDIQDLCSYTRYNFIALKALIKEHDMHTHYNAQQWLLDITRSKQLDKQRFDILLTKVFTLYDFCLEEKALNGLNQSISAKYWVHYDNINELKAILLFHLPLLESTEPVSSIYLDNSEFDLYQARLQRDPDAEALRFRWYNANDMLVERKTTHQDGTLTKDSFTIDIHQMGAFVTGKHITKENLAVASRIQTSISENQLKPTLRMSHHRSEDSKSNTWCKPLIKPKDAEVYKFPYAILEIKFYGQDPPHWLTSLLESQLVHEVPCFSKYLQGIASLWNTQLPLLPWWTSQLKLDIRNTKKPTGDFTALSQSKHMKPWIDGKCRVGYLESKLKELSLLKKSNQKKSSLTLRLSVNNPFDDPIWSNASPIISRHTTDHIETGSTEHLMGDKLVSSLQHPSNEKPGQAHVDNAHSNKDLEEGIKKKKNKEKSEATTEPKLFFANERTFIQWLNFAAILLTAALTLMNFGDTINKIIGGVFFGIAFLFAFYSFGFSRWRAYRIIHKPHLRYDDIFGPVFLCILLVGALILNFALRYNTPITNTGYLGTNITATDAM
ncbi:vacuolar transporter chaperone [Rhizopus stolonifer]|uniref:Vacuolar transporter chaperone n=1 Tax=Rhizopus stolonifer TaxID=4846 RepID=A0A367JRB3_RHIST|nr:vacuolar transporter chaperone [Rhizopus stolonifer]